MNEKTRYEEIIDTYNLNISEFYFIIYTNNETEIAVIDLSWACSYEMTEWSLVESEADKYYDLEEAISIAKNLAERKGLVYNQFDSRYHNVLNQIEDDNEIEFSF